MRAECASKRNQSVAPSGQKSAKCPVTARIALAMPRGEPLERGCRRRSGRWPGAATLRPAAKMRAVMPADGLVVRCELDEHPREHPGDFPPAKVEVLDSCT
jgi:hypothetical protein